MIEEHEIDFVRAFWERRAVTAYVLFGANILVFSLMSLAGGTTNEATLLAFGVKSNFEINAGEIWRFVTPIFIHIGLLHLASNSYAIWIVAPQVEKLYGSSRFLLLYVLTGMAGVAASYAYHPNIISAGASGAIFGLFGALLVFSVKYRKSVPQFFSQAIGKGMLTTIGLNLVIGYMIPQVDNSAHVGGLLAGGLLALVVPYQKPGESTGRPFRVIEALLALIVAVSFFEVALHYNGPELSAGNLFKGFRGSSGATVEGFVNAVNRSQQAFERSEAALSAGNAGALEAAHKDLGVAVDMLQNAPSMSRRSDEITRDMLEVLRKQYEYVGTVQRNGGKGTTDFIGASPQSRRYAQIERDFERWVDTEGARFGIVNSR